MDSDNILPGVSVIVETVAGSITPLVVVGLALYCFCCKGERDSSGSLPNYSSSNNQNGWSAFLGGTRDESSRENRGWFSSNNSSSSEGVCSGGSIR